MLDHILCLIRLNVWTRWESWSTGKQDAPLLPALMAASRESTKEMKDEDGGTQIRRWWGMRSRGAGLASSNAGPGRVSRLAGTRRSRAKSPAPPSPRVRRRPKRPPASDVTWGQMADGSEAAQRREGRFRERSGRRRKLMSSRRPARVSGETGLRGGG